MNNEERKIFWETLCSLPGVDLKEDMDLLNKTIIFPKYVYRFRTVNDNTLNALRENKVYFSTSNYYDDPFDTFIQVDLKGLRNFLDEVIQSFPSDDQIATGIEYILLKLFNRQVNDEEKNILVMQLKNMLVNPNFQMVMMEYIRNIRNEIKKDTWSVCFSEDGLNENLWIKYANQHRGFVVTYDLENGTNLRCGKQEKCNECGIYKFGAPLYPIYYSDEKYDATKFAQFLSICKMMGDNLNEEVLKKITTDMGNQIWEREKITLIKKACHKYDKEWRMVTRANFNEGPVMREWIPDAVILGLLMEKSAEAQVIGTAYQAGIKKIYKCFIDDKGNLDAYLMPMIGEMC